MSLTLNTNVYPFDGTTKNNNVQWSYSSTGVPNGASVADFVIRPPVKTGGVYKIEGHLTLPKVASDPSACSCPGEIISTEQAFVSVLIPGSSTTAERTDFALRLKDFIASTQFQNALTAFTRPSA